MAACDTELPEDAACEKCGYSICALTVDRCPECGTAFNRAHILARLRGEVVKLPFDRNAAKMLAPPPWWATEAAVIAIGFSFTPESIIPNVNGHPPPVIAIALFALAAGAFLLRALEHRSVGERYDLTGAPKRQFGINWILLPAALVLFGVATRTDFTGRIAFYLCQPQMDALVQKVSASPRYTPDQRVGFYDAVQIYPTADGITFRLKGHTDTGFVFTNTGNLPTSRNDTEPWGGGWYVIRGE